MSLPMPQSRIMNDDQLTRHRAFIAVKAQALMGRYFQMPQDELVQRDIILGWMDMLQDYTKEDIEFGCREYLVVYPRTRPHEGLVKGLIDKRRQQYVNSLPKHEEPVEHRQLPDLEARKRLVAELLGKHKVFK